MFLQLQGKTKKGKERIKRFTNLWFVMREENRIYCLQGPGMLMASIEEFNSFNDTKKFPETSRWLAKTNDPDFEVVTMFNDLQDIPTEQLNKHGFELEKVFKNDH